MTPPTFVPDRFTAVVFAVVRFLTFNASAVVPAFVIATRAKMVAVNVAAPAVNVAIFLDASSAIVFVLVKFRTWPFVNALDCLSVTTTIQFSFTSITEVITQFFIYPARGQVLILLAPCQLVLFH